MGQTCWLTYRGLPVLLQSEVVATEVMSSLPEGAEFVQANGHRVRFQSEFSFHTY